MRLFPYPYIAGIHHGNNIIISILYYYYSAEDTCPFLYLLLQVYMLNPVQIYR